MNATPIPSTPPTPAKQADALFDHENKTCPCCGRFDWREGPPISPWPELLRTSSACLRECVFCGTAHLPPMRYLSYAARPADTAAATETATHSLKAQVNVQRLIPFLSEYVRSERPTAIDVGCSTGYEIEWLLKSPIVFRYVHGIEPSENAVKMAVARFHGNDRVTVFQGYVSDIPDGSYDFVMATMVWEHIPDPGEALRVVRDRQPVGGLIALQVPRYDNAIPRRIRSRLWHGVHPHHLWYFTKRGFRMMAERNGYRVVQIVNTPRVATLRYALTRGAGALYRHVAPYRRIPWIENRISARWSGTAGTPAFERALPPRVYLRIGLLRDSMLLVGTKNCA